MLGTSKTCQFIEANELSTRPSQAAGAGVPPPATRPLVPGSDENERAGSAGVPGRRARARDGAWVPVLDGPHDRGMAPLVAETGTTARPDLPAGSAYPPRDLRRTAGQVADGMEPVLDQAYASSTRAFDPAFRPATMSAGQDVAPRVNNTFNVKVAVGETHDSVPDAGALEKALVDVLRTAARRQGLEI